MEQVQNKIDLHVHTNHSDGTMSPTEVVKYAKEKGLVAISVSDHDTTSGNAEAVEAGGEFGVDVVPGVEISADYDPGTLHILGYFIDPGKPGMKKIIEWLQAERDSRNREIAKKLKRLGVEIKFEDVEAVAGEDQIGRPHFAEVLIKKGYAGRFSEAFEKYLKKGGPAYVPRKKPSPRQCVEAIAESGGIAALAHPKQLRLKEEALTGFVNELVGYGLKGIEAYSSCHSKSEIKKYRKVGERLDLFVTAGSDFHGERNEGVDLGDVGHTNAPTVEVVWAMKEYLGIK